VIRGHYSHPEGGNELSFGFAQGFSCFMMNRIRALYFENSDQPAGVQKAKMEQIQEATPRVKKNIFLIRVILALALYSYAFFYLQANPDKKTIVLVYAAILAVTFIPFFLLDEEKFEKVRFQYLVFSMDFVVLMLGLYLLAHMETNLLILIFFTFFISALSQSVGRSIIVAFAIIALYVYLCFIGNEVFNYFDPFFYLSCALLFVISVHSGYLAYRTVQEEREIMELGIKTDQLSEKVREGDQAALNYAASLKNVLDTLPVGAIAVSTEGVILFVNVKAGKILDLNPKNLANLYLYMKNNPLGEIGELMGQSLKDRRELKKEYLEMNWQGAKKRFRLDSSIGTSPAGKVWGILFMLQEASSPSPADPAPQD
jgi:PAS domain-containing protein